MAHVEPIPTLPEGATLAEVIEKVNELVGETNDTTQHHREQMERAYLKENGLTRI